MIQNSEEKKEKTAMQEIFEFLKNHKLIVTYGRALNNPLEKVMTFEIEEKYDIETSKKVVL